MNTAPTFCPADFVATHRDSTHHRDVQLVDTYARYGDTWANVRQRVGVITAVRLDGLTPLPTATAVEQWGYIHEGGRFWPVQDEARARDVVAHRALRGDTLARLVAVDPATLPAGTRVLVLADEAGVALGVRE